MHSDCNIFSSEEMGIYISTHKGSFRLIHSNLTLQEENWPSPLADFGNISIILKPTSHVALCF